MSLKEELVLRYVPGGKDGGKGSSEILAAIRKDGESILPVDVRKYLVKLYRAGKINRFKTAIGAYSYWRGEDDIEVINISNKKTIFDKVVDSLPLKPEEAKSTIDIAKAIGHKNVSAAATLLYKRGRICREKREINGKILYVYWKEDKEGDSDISEMEDIDLFDKLTKKYGALVNRTNETIVEIEEGYMKTIHRLQEENERLLAELTRINRKYAELRAPEFEKMEREIDRVLKAATEKEWAVREGIMR